MKRRLFSLAVAFGLVAACLAYPTSAADSCDECRAECNDIPMAREECLEMYCPECAGASLTGGSQAGLGR